MHSFFFFLKVVLLQNHKYSTDMKSYKHMILLTIRSMSSCLGVNQLGNSVVRIQGVLDSGLGF